MCRFLAKVTSVVGVVTMGNNEPGASFSNPDVLLFRGWHLTIRLSWLPDATMLFTPTCLCGPLPYRLGHCIAGWDVAQAIEHSTVKVLVHKRLWYVMFCLYEDS